MRGFGVGLVLAIVALLIGVAGIGYFVLHTNADVSGNDDVTYSWTFADAGTDAGGIPQTTVTLHAGEKGYPIGTYQGSCAEQNTDLLPDEKSKVICWYAGGGKEIGLFEEKGKLVVKVGDVDEGDAETPGFRGNFRVLLGL